MRKIFFLTLIFLIGIQASPSLFAHVPRETTHFRTIQTDKKIFRHNVQRDEEVQKVQSTSVNRIKSGFGSRLKNKLIRLAMKLAKGKGVDDRPYHWSAITALVCGGLTLFTGLLFLPAIIFGAIGVLKTGPKKEYKGLGMAIAGLGLGLLIGALFILYIIYLASFY